MSIDTLFCDDDPPVVLPPTAPKACAMLTLANEALCSLVPSEGRRRELLALAVAEAEHWRFLGQREHQYMLAKEILIVAELSTGKKIDIIPALRPGQVMRYTVRSKS